MTRPRAWIAHFVFIVALAIPSGLLAQSPARRRAVRQPVVDAITILQTTDIHDHANGAGHVGLDVDPATAMSTTGAYARIAAYVNNVRTIAGHPVILVDSGDYTMGTLYDLTLGSQPLALGFISSMRYDAITLGNHEFDYTPRGLAGMIALAQSTFAFQTPIVASNMDLHGNADLTPFFGTGKPIRTTYVETLSNGVKVGCFTRRCKTISCWRSRTFSKISSDLLRVISPSIPTLPEALIGVVQHKTFCWSCCQGTIRSLRNRSLSSGGLFGIISGQVGSGQASAPLTQLAL